MLQVAEESTAGPALPPSTTESEDNLGLSACQGIVQEHRGVISSEQREDGRILLRVELPATAAVPVKGKEKTPTVPVLWQSISDAIRPP